LSYNPEHDREAQMERIRKEIMRRIEEGDIHLPEFYRPNNLNGKQRYSPTDEHADRGTVSPLASFAAASAYSNYAARIVARRIKDSVFYWPLTLIIVGDANGARHASHEESIAILTSEDRWNDTTPAWAENFVPTFSYEDDILLKEMQLFTGGDHATS
jgi:hypothetical protein